ncbi:SDR family oxidoreductase [Herbaspirillum sp. WKF16]|nr:SDR family oxidoreductase [Herbaspirillum sp. WKF16]WDZ98369.1 SDR family oxidoreductase [Herbaspirillum sp. WKF16]
MRILITGASGFIGSALTKHLLEQGDYEVRAASRDPSQISLSAEHLELAQMDGLEPDGDWRTMLKDVDCVIHCAARVHVMHEKATDPLAEFRRVNVAGTLALARQAQTLGVKRFVFLSSVKVNGEESQRGAPFRADDPPSPSDAYGVSKLEAEQALSTLASIGEMEISVIRPVLVYGPGVKANFRSMIRWLDKGVPLPLGGVTHNRRSLVAIDNLIDILTLCIHHPAAAGQVFLASDGDDMSTTEMLRRIGKALGKRAPLLSVPPELLRLAARFLGRPAVAQRLCSSLQVDISKNQALLDWIPPVSSDVALSRTVEAYRRGV